MTTGTIDSTVERIELDSKEILAIDLFKLYEAYCRVRKKKATNDDWRYLKSEGWDTLTKEGKLQYKKFGIEIIKEGDRSKKVIVTINPGRATAFRRRAEGYLREAKKPDRTNPLLLLNHASTYD